MTTAQYAAIVATITLLWNIFSWLMNKRKLVLKCDFVVIRGTQEHPYPDDFVEYKIINRSDKTLSLFEIAGTKKGSEGKIKFSLPLDERPMRINPLDSAKVYKLAPDVFGEGDLIDLYIADSIGRKYKLSRWTLKKLKKKAKDLYV